MTKQEMIEKLITTHNYLADRGIIPTLTDEVVSALQNSVVLSKEQGEAASKCINFAVMGCMCDECGKTLETMNEIDLQLGRDERGFRND